MSSVSTTAERILDMGPAKGSPLHCSFCGKHEDMVRKLVAGLSALICDACIGRCVEVLDDDQVALSFAEPTLSQTQTLMDLLESEGARGATARIGLQQIVDVLRSRKISWAVIGAALGVSRQAAWERFGRVEPATPDAS